MLVAPEHLTAEGMSPELAALLAERRGWSAERVAMFDASFALYWRRSEDLARRTRWWPAPRRRHVALIGDALSVRPYVQLLNTSAWTLYESDFDPERSHAELGAYLLAHGDRMALLGEVTQAALLNAAWWFERSDSECAAFAAAAAASTRPDSAALQALAAALPWLRRLRHAELRPASTATHRAIPGAALLVPRADEAEPQRLVERWTGVARAAVDAYLSAWRAPDAVAVGALADWLADAAPQVLITARGGRVLWDRRSPARVAALRAELTPASGVAVRAVHADLAVLDRHTHRFLASLTDPAALPAAAPESEQRGYTYMQRAHRLLVYDLDEPGIDRRHGPALPFARAMLGARAVHEWAHLAVDAGWVPLAVPAEELDRRVAVLAGQLDAVVAAAPEHLRRTTADDLATLTAGTAAPGTALAGVVLRRMSDFQANLLAARYLDEAERETYVRQNVRTLRAEYAPAQLWHALVRYLYELQYLRFSAVADRRTFFLRSTWFDADFLDGGGLDEARFDALAAAVGAICDCYAVDERRFAT